MIPRAPQSKLPTHEVVNTPPHLGDQALWDSDTALKSWTTSQGAGAHTGFLSRAGSRFGAADVFRQADQANRFPPQIRAFDRYGMRINQVEFHPAYHDLMSLAIEHEAPSFAWRNPGPGAHVGHAALTYMFSQAEGGVMCPMAMTYSAIPTLQTTPAIAKEWIPRVLSTSYDPRDIPVAGKSGATMGMFMTEKQGGSDVRTNTTRAVPEGSATGAGAAYRVTGHKFFCSAPMCDAFLVLARTEGGLSCFLMPRWRPDGTRNGLYIQRLKDKLGNRSNASSEMEFQDTHAVMVGEEGRGIRTIIDMVRGNRIYCAMSSAGLMRQALVQALHHVSHRTAFGKRLVDQPLMRNVLADLAIEVEAELALGMRIAAAIDQAEAGGSEAALARLGTTVAKYWNCKRAPTQILEALECLGGPGYIEESILPRLYREAPINSIWEGSGNVMCLDVLRAAGREPETLDAFFAELEAARGADTRLDAESAALRSDFGQGGNLEIQARTLTERMAIALQAALLVRHAPAEIADAFCASRLGRRWSGAYGTLPATVNFDAVIRRAMPA
ncbi:MAG: acyl-CoA dehydrogenase family protein [Gammaproteobacteria bacterium]|nr:acyl-CoA dehydrogenase family protein [Gammaproteobacteria bacterium]